MKMALTIAGSDPTGGAGLQADLKVFRAFEVYGLSVVSAITVQNTEGVDSIFPVEKKFFEKQLNVLLSDIRPDAIKIGMIYSRWAVEVVAKIIEKFTVNNLVIDPVIVSSSGVNLIENKTIDALRKRLFPLSKVITPNRYEASVLTGIMIDSRENMEKAAKILRETGPEVVVITGGDLEEISLDLFYDGSFHYLEGIKKEGKYHGTGCVFSAAIASLLALGHTPLESTKKAKEFMNNVIKNAFQPGKGMGLLYI